MLAELIFCLLGIDAVQCVKWSPKGDMFAFGTSNGVVTVIDFVSGQEVFVDDTSDGSKFLWGNIFVIYLMNV